LKHPNGAMVTAIDIRLLVLRLASKAGIVVCSSAIVAVI